jgi:DUF1680 family protein
MGLPYPRAYEMTSVFIGVTEYYRMTGNPRLKQSVINYFKNVRDKKITIVGNGGGHGIGGEGWNNMASEQSNPDVKKMMETCTGAAWLRFCSHILRLTGDSSDADAIEKYVYNGLIGAMKPHGDGFSYLNLLNGRKVDNHGNWWKEFNKIYVSCCNLNGPTGLSYPYIAAMQDGQHNPVINLYEPATIETKTPKGKSLTLEIVS